jgi:alginate export protein
MRQANDLPAALPPANRTRSLRRVAIAYAALLSVSSVRLAAAASDDSPAPAEEPPARPAILFNRWQEDWSVLANPDVPKEPFDNLKYISLSDQDPQTYLSLGADLRERFESNDATNFGVGTNHKADYDISRLETDADLRIAGQFQFFAQLQSDYAIDKNVHTPVDQDRLDLEQAFVALTEPLDNGLLKVRLGRQQFGFDLQRFVSVRDGPNVRQSYDAAWVDYEHGKWRYITFYSHPVQDRDLRPFDDYSSPKLSYGGFRVERKVMQSASVAVYVSRFSQEDTRFPSITGNERRNIVDVHFAGTHGPMDWDIEAMHQSGRIGIEDIEAWAFGSLGGYTFTSIPWTPRLGLQVDAASGDKNPLDNQLNTFNPLFPNGYYVTLAGYTGFVNFIHLKPSVTLHPLPRLKLMTAIGAQWRETTADAVYTQPDNAVAGTAGRAGQYTGTYGQFRGDYILTEHVWLALEVVHFAVSDVIREVGGHDSNYIGAEIRMGW